MSRIDYPETPARTVEEATQRLLTRATAVKRQMMENAATGRSGVTWNITLAMELQTLAHCYRIIMGEMFPEEFRLNGLQEFDADGNKVRRI